MNDLPHTGVEAARGKDLWMDLENLHCYGVGPKQQGVINRPN